MIPRSRNQLLEPGWLRKGIGVKQGDPITVLSAPRRQIIGCCKPNILLELYQRYLGKLGGDCLTGSIAARVIDDEDLRRMKSLAADAP